ncbi:MAG: DUF255 domain-containing protein [Crocinitomix sp.]|nr:DUF255 domain-containing protein [Crocinitomix sp.]
MKNVLIAILMIMGLSSYGEEINFQKFTTLEDALALSKKEKKPILIDTWASWCGWCTFMDENIFSDSEVATYFNANFIALKLNADGNNSGDFMSEYEISGLPALLILDENGAVLSRSDGAITEITDFIEFGKVAYYKLNPETSPWYKKEQEFEAGNRDYLFLQEYAVSLLDGDVAYEKVSAVNYLYWENTPSKSLKDSTNFLMFYIFVNEFSNPLTDAFVADKTELIAIVGESLYYEKGIAIIQANIDEATVTDNKEQYENILSFTERVFLNQEIVDYDELMGTIKEIWKER